MTYIYYGLFRISEKLMLFDCTFSSLIQIFDLWISCLQDLAIQSRYPVTFTIGYDQKNNIDAALKKVVSFYLVHLFSLVFPFSRHNKFIFNVFINFRSISLNMDRFLNFIFFTGVLKIFFCFETITRGISFMSLITNGKKRLWFNYGVLSLPRTHFRIFAGNYGVKKEKFHYFMSSNDLRHLLCPSPLTIS